MPLLPASLSSFVRRLFPNSTQISFLSALLVIFLIRKINSFRKSKRALLSLPSSSPLLYPAADSSSPALFPHFFSNNRGVYLYHRSWITEKRGLNERRGAVIILHGFAEHCNRYASVAEYFNSLGLDVFSFDQEGHGQSHGSRAYIESMDHFVDNAHQFVCRVQQEYKRKGEEPNMYLFGHSMGGLIASLLLARIDPLKDEVSSSSTSSVRPFLGAIISSPCAALLPQPPFVIKLVMFLNSFVPHLPLAHLDTSAISRMEDVITQNHADHLIYHSGVKVRSVIEMFLGGERVRKEAPKITTDLLLLHGDKDRLCFIDGTKELAARASSKEKEFKIYEGAFHELLNDSIRDKVFEDIGHWMNKHFDKNDKRFV